jgi:hypothetical protein
VVQGELHYWFIKDQKTLVRTFLTIAQKTVPIPSGGVARW